MFWCHSIPSNQNICVNTPKLWTGINDFEGLPKNNFSFEKLLCMYFILGQWGEWILIEGWAMFGCKTQTNTFEKWKNTFQRIKEIFVCVSFLHSEGDGEQSRVQLNGILSVATKKSRQLKKLKIYIWQTQDKCIWKHKRNTF